MAVFWDVAPCSLVDIDWRFREASCLHHQCKQGDNGGSKLFWNVGQYPPDYTVLHQRRQPATFILVAVRAWNLT
jgi:hypothetical protein